MRRVPTSFSPDWPRKVANVLGDLILGQDALENATDWSALGDYADDTAAAAGGVEVGGLYHNAGAVRVRLT